MTKQTTSNHRYAASFSLVGSALITLFFALVNLFSGARFPWAIYPIFAVLWWPLAIYYFVYKPRKRKQASQQ